MYIYMANAFLPTHKCIQCGRAQGLPPSIVPYLCRPLKGTERKQRGRDYRLIPGNVPIGLFYPRPRVWDHQRAGWVSIPIEASQITEPLDWLRKPEIRSLSLFFSLSFCPSLSLDLSISLSVSLSLSARHRHKLRFVAAAAASRARGHHSQRALVRSAEVN